MVIGSKSEFEVIVESSLARDFDWTRLGIVYQSNLDIDVSVIYVQDLLDVHWMWNEFWGLALKSLSGVTGCEFDSI